jgi:hypothetical protein
MRDSSLYFERNFYDAFYQKIITWWEEPTFIVLNGNSGVGISFYQIYLLRRLLNEKGRAYPFVVHQKGTAFFLYHFETCKVWQLRGDRDYIECLLNSIENSLYFFEPWPSTKQVFPLSTDSRSILFESPNSIKINERSRFLYMPNGTLDELLVVAEEENLDANAVKETYDKLGGIMRYALRTKDRDRGKGFGRIMPR